MLIENCVYDYEQDSKATCQHRRDESTKDSKSRQAVMLITVVKA